ncbi:MAG TPA: protein kinase [Verrucomicrobiae bacterium]|nr:protein kinase [Verrucomicrobiae bacterium]
MPPPTREQVAAAFPQLEILELIGQGGMGFVFKVRQPKLNRIVALKILPQSLAADPAFAERFAREGRMLALLNHPNIVTIHDFGQANNLFYLLMEFVDGVNLRQAMKAGRFTPEQALAVVPKICEALQFAHNEGVLHRDIKPENILLDNKGRVKIADFGIAKLVQRESTIDGSGNESSTTFKSKAPGADATQANLTETGKVLGTPNYMAPEQLERRQKVDHRADIYSLGVVFYEMLTGELPLGRFQPPSQRVEVDVRLDEVVLHALEKEPSMRYQQASQVKTAVESIANRPSPGQPPFVAPTGPPGRRFWKRFALAAAGCVLAAIILPFLLYHLARRNNPAAAQLDLVQAAENHNPPVVATNEATATTDEIARLKLQHAELEFERAKARNEAGVITSADYQKAKYARDIAAAELSQDKLGVAKLNLESAQVQLDLASKLFEVGRTTSTDYENAKLARDIAAVQLKKLEMTNGK